MSDYLNPPAALLEPSVGCTAGDRVPCHLFLPDVAWPTPLGPVIRPERARHARPALRDQWLQPPVTPWRPAETEAARSGAWRRAALAAILLSVAGFWIAVGLLVHVARSESAPVAPRPAPRPVVHVPAPVVGIPATLARPAVRCERNQLWQCVEVQR